MAFGHVKTRDSTPWFLPGLSTTVAHSSSHDCNKIIHARSPNGLQHNLEGAGPVRMQSKNIRHLNPDSKRQAC